MRTTEPRTCGCLIPRLRAYRGSGTREEVAG